MKKPVSEFVESWLTAFLGLIFVAVALRYGGHGLRAVSFVFAMAITFASLTELQNKRRAAENGSERNSSEVAQSDQPTYLTPAIVHLAFFIWFFGVFDGISSSRCCR